MYIKKRSFLKQKKDGTVPPTCRGDSGGLSPPAKSEAKAGVKRRSVAEEQTIALRFALRFGLLPPQSRRDCGQTVEKKLQNNLERKTIALILVHK